MRCLLLDITGSIATSRVNNHARVKNHHSATSLKADSVLCSILDNQRWTWWSHEHPARATGLVIHSHGLMMYYNAGQTDGIHSESALPTDIMPETRARETGRSGHPATSEPESGTERAHIFRSGFATSHFLSNASAAHLPAGSWHEKHNLRKLKGPNRLSKSRAPQPILLAQAASPSSSTSEVPVRRIA